MTKTAQSTRDYVAQAAGFVKSDGSDRCCGDVSNTGKICTMYVPEKQRCAILGHITVPPAATCIHQITGPTRSTLVQDLTTAKEVGLTDTKQGATCQYCDHREEAHGRSICRILTLLLKTVLGSSAMFPISAGDCCDFWKRDGVEERIGW